MANQLSAIDHIVVLALENRSFDQMLGFLYTDRNNESLTGQPYEGLTGTESNPDGKGGAVTVFKITPDMRNAYFMPGCDPGENYQQVNEQLFGSGMLDAPTPPVATNEGFLVNYIRNLPARSKNPRFGALPGTVAKNIMGMFAPETLPVLSALARGYAVCDHWFASVPTETMPNRSFMCAATSRGRLGDKPTTPYITAPSIFGRLTDAKIPWKIYGYTEKPLSRTNFNDVISAPASNFGKFADFKAEAAAGTLPAYCFLEPQWGRKGNSQHPNYSLATGEQLMSDVYNAVLNGKNWEKTLLIITYDEHGGNYDHVPPPQGAIPPDDALGDDKNHFDFRRFGVRVPAVLISPLVKAGSVFRVPEGTMPLDHTSILKTVEKRWSLIPLTARDAGAPDVGDALQLATPRTDNVLAGIKVPKAAGQTSAPNKPSELRRIHAEALANLPVPDSAGRTDHDMPKLRTGDDYTKYIAKRTDAWDRNLAANPPPKVLPAKWRVANPPASKSQGPRQVVLLRHGEKPTNPRIPDLSPAGFKRAEMLAKQIPQFFPNPQVLFATAPSKHSNRPIETLTPLARAETLQLHIDIGDNGYAVLADELLRQSAFEDKLIIVCWHHGNIPDIALALGVPKNQMNDKLGMNGMKWDPKHFDLFWSITFEGAKPSLKISKQPPV